MRGLRPRLHTLDNEASTSLKDFLTAEKVEYQLVPPHIHRRNSTERAIQTFKNHFIAGQASTDPIFPLSNWCRLLPQAELTLNVLRPSRLNHKLSAYAQLEGAFDFNCTPPGTRVIVHEKPTQRRTWAWHSVDGWYIGPAMDHYQCYRVWIPSTHTERIADTIQFFRPFFAPRLYPTVTPLSKLHVNSLTPFKTSTTPTHCPNCLTTNCKHYISSARFFPPGATGVEHNSSPKHPQVPLLPSHHTTTCVLDLTIHCRHHPRLLVLPLNHATTYVLEFNMPPPSPMPTPADLWNTAISLQIPPLATSGSALPPTNLDDFPKAFPIIASTPPTLS